MYKSVYESRSNYPIDGYELLIKENSAFRQIFLFGRTNVLTYHDPSKNKYRKYKDPVWAVCIDGKVYIRHKYSYFPVETIRKYSLFLSNGWYWQSHGTTGKDYFSFPQYYKKEQILIPSKNKVLSLTKPNVQKLLEQEESNLLDEFKADKIGYYDTVLLKTYISRLNDEVENRIEHNY